MGTLNAIYVETDMTVLWDRIPIHKGTPIDQFLTEHPDVAIEPFPPYAPELNAADGIWRYVKHARLPNHTPRDLDSLRLSLVTELKRLRRRAGLLYSFIRFTKLPIDV